MDIADLKRRAGIGENVVIKSNSNGAKYNALIYAAKGAKAQYDELMQNNSIGNDLADELATIINELNDRAKKLG